MKSFGWLKSVFCITMMLVGTQLWAATPLAWNLFSGAFNSGKGPVWMTMTIQGGQAGETWSFETATLSWTKLGQTSSANVLDDLMRVQRFEVGTTPKVVHFVYHMPEAVLEYSTIDLSLAVTLRTSGNVLVGPLTSTDLSVDILSRREQYWDRIPGSQETVVAYTPGSYLTFDFEGAGLFAYLGKSINLGKIAVSLDGNVLGETLDMFPEDLPLDSTATSSSRTDYVKTRLMETSGNNASHRIKLELLTERNERSVGTGMAITAFAIERYVGSTKQISETEVMTANIDLKLHSSPSSFDANLLLSQLGFSGNLESLVADLDANLAGNTSDNTSSGNTSAKPIGEEHLKAAFVQSVDGVTFFNKARLSVDVSNGNFVLLSIDNGLQQKSYVWSSLAGQTVEFTKGDQVHRLQLQMVSPLGLNQSSPYLYYVPLASPQAWPAGQSSLTVSGPSGDLYLQRSDIQSAWEVGFIRSNGLLGSAGKDLLVVQKPGVYEALDFSVSARSSLEGLAAQSVTKSSTGIQLQKGNFVELSSSSESGSNSSSVSVSGGGGGCLLR